MSVRRQGGGVGRRAAFVAAAAICALFVGTGAARAETTFGGEPNGAVSSEASCGPATCTLYWNGPGGSDVAPIPASGGSGTITSVTLPAMPEPGTMQAVLLTSSQPAGNGGSADYMCCQVKEVSAPFTVPANTVATVPLSLHASATATAAVGTPGATLTGDGVGISVLTWNASTPLRATENPADELRNWLPALTAPSSSFVEPNGDALGYELEARFTFVETPGGGKTATPPGGTTPGQAARASVRLRGRIFRPGRDGRTLVLGRATNPPTASTTQMLTLPTAGASAGKAKKPVVLGSGKTTVPSGKSAPLKLTLNGKGRAALAKGHTLKATLTVVATDAQGESSTLTRSVTIKPAAKKRAL